MATTPGPLAHHPHESQLSAGAKERLRPERRSLASRASEEGGRDWRLGEIALPASLEEAFRRRGRPPKQEPLVLGDELRTYDSRWHGELRTGADLRRWRESVGLYQKELAVLLDAAVTSLVRTEQSQSPSSRVIYGVELLREKLSNGQLDFRPLLRGRPGERLLPAHLLIEAAIREANATLESFAERTCRFTTGVPSCVPRLCDSSSTA